jgi:D-3-phosphoglycerate dehydrogenase
VVGIIGYGNIGKEVARILKVFNFNILVYDPYVKENLEEENINKVDLDYLIKSSDVITIHCPMNAETKNLIKYSDFLKMKRTAILINTARAAIVNQIDLKKALKSKLIKAAYLDVYEKEPLEHDDDFYLMQNVYMAPHIGGASKMVIELQSKMIYEDIMNYINRSKLKNEFALNN